MNNRTKTEIVSPQENREIVSGKGEMLEAPTTVESELKESDLDDSESEEDTRRSFQDILEATLYPVVYSEINANEWLNEYGKQTLISFKSSVIYEFKYKILKSDNLDWAIDATSAGGALWLDSNHNFFRGRAGWVDGRPVMCDIKTGNIYVSNYWGSNPFDIELLANNITAILCPWQYSIEDINERKDGDSAVLLDQYCEPLSNQLKFDYGNQIEVVVDEYNAYTFNEYLIISLIYDTLTERYIAIYGINSHAFIDSSTSWVDVDWNDVNSKRKIGVAIFDIAGNQLERYWLSHITYPQFTSNKIFLAPNGSSENPQLFLIEENQLLIVPREGNDITGLMMQYNGEKTTAPVLLDLVTQETTLWTHEEMADFLEKSDKYKGKLPTAWNADKIWTVKEKQPPIPYEFVYEETDEGEIVTLVYMLGEKMALFALPGKVNTEIWTQTDDGTIHAIVTVTKEMED